MLDQDKKYRIIPCLDVKDGRVVKGVQFVDLKDAGDPVEMAEFYVAEGADELVALDISASYEGRGVMLDLVVRIADKVTIPLIIGGGIKSRHDVAALLAAGADKVSIGSMAVEKPGLIRAIKEEFGSQVLVVAIDAKFNPETGKYQVMTQGGRHVSDWEAVAWARELEDLGAGELLVTSMGRDGEKSGFDLDLVGQIADAVSIPVIASGGAGKKEDFLDLFTKTKADAGLAASIFHYKETSVKEVKNFLNDHLK